MNPQYAVRQIFGRFVFHSLILMQESEYNTFQLELKRRKEIAKVGLEVEVFRSISFWYISIHKH